VALSTLPTGLYYLYGTVVAAFLRGQTSRKVLPQLLLKVSFWEGWLAMVWIVVGAIAFVGALYGMLLFRKGAPRALIIGLWSGYFLFGMAFTHHIHTHSYYSLQLIPVVALSLAPTVALVMRYLNHAVNLNRFGRVDLRSHGGVIILALSLSVLILGVVEHKLGLVEHKQSVGLIAKQERTASIYAHYVATFQEIGEVVHHSHRALVLFGCPQYIGQPNCGLALMYHGRLLGRTWPNPDRIVQEGKIRLVQERRREISTERRFDRYLKKPSSEYFIISKGWWEAEETKDLRGFLIKNFPMTARNDDYVVFDLRERR
jgi:hypothetical protein